MLIAAIIGFLFGFIGSMPIAGPIAVLVVARSLEGRFASALRVGVGSAVAETGYALLAFWGSSTLLADHAWLVPASRGAAAIILLALGVVFVRRRSPPVVPGREDPRRAAGAFLLGLSITGLNPTLIATWAAAATALLSTALVTSSPSLAVPFGVGAGAGIASWYLVLVRIIRRRRGRFRPAALERVVRAMGGLLLVVGLFFAWRLISWLAGLG